MLPDPIPDSEYLYRRVILKPDYWKVEFNKPSSAVFKDSKGVSVDRDGGRCENEVIESIPKENIKAVIKILTKDCRDLQAHPIYKPIPTNEFHSEIHNSTTEIEIKSKKKARDLCKKTENCIVY